LRAAQSEQGILEIFGLLIPLLLVTLTDTTPCLAVKNTAGFASTLSADIIATLTMKFWPFPTIGGEVLGAPLRVSKQVGADVIIPKNLSVVSAATLTVNIRVDHHSIPPSRRVAGIKGQAFGEPQIRVE